MILRWRRALASLFRRRRPSPPPRPRRRPGDNYPSWLHVRDLTEDELRDHGRRLERPEQGRGRGWLDRPRIRDRGW